MKFLDVLLTAIDALRGNWVRSVLTALGVIIGIAAVIVMVSVGQGTQQALDEAISSLGSNRIEVFASSSGRGGVQSGADSQVTLTEDDADAIRREVAGVQFAATSVRGGAQVVYGGANWATQVYGINADYLPVNGIEVARGEDFSERDYRSAGKVLLLGATVARNLFGDDDPVGATLRVKRVPFRVVGVLTERGQSGWGGDQDDVIMMPIGTAKRRVLGQEGVGDQGVRQISLGVMSADDLAYVETEAASLLRQRHNIGPGGTDDFRIRNLTEIVSARTETTRLMSILLGAVALISLIVGGIGIMNIMLVSVTERIREIGLRLAVGATPAEIRAQFLAEAMGISLAGGLIGILLGIGGTLIAARVSSLPAALSVDTILLATAFSVATGLFFGYYPAHKAAQLDPIEALRHD